jgi:hypothetical protein
MGQFTERYEKLQTWAALPAEPFAPENDAERLTASTSASPADVGGTTASISVSVTPEVPDATEGDSTD